MELYPKFNSGDSHNPLVYIDFSFAEDVMHYIFHQSGISRSYFGHFSVVLDQFKFILDLLEIMSGHFRSF